MSENREESARPHTHKNNLGLGLRLVQAALAAQIAAAWVNGALLDVHDFAYDFSLVRGVAMVAWAAVSIYLIQMREAVARPFVIIGVMVTLAFSLIDNVALGAAAEIAPHLGSMQRTIIMATQAGACLIMVLYLGLSPRAKQVLCRRLKTAGAPSPLPTSLPFRQRVHTWPFWRNLIIYFIVFSFVGHWAEMLFCRLIVAGVFMGDYDPANAMLWTHWLFPFTAEGAAVALIVLLLHPLAEWLLRKTGGRYLLAVPLSFLANGLVCTAIDFTTGMVANQDYSLWDYRALPFNFMGQVCLQNSLVYTLAATLIVWLVYPLMDRGIAKIAPWLVNAIFWGLLAAYGFLALLHFVSYSA